jgi:hypothetical protein
MASQRRKLHVHAEDRAGDVLSAVAAYLYDLGLEGAVTPNNDGWSLEVRPASPRGKVLISFGSNPDDPELPHMQRPVTIEQAMAEIRRRFVLTAQSSSFSFASENHRYAFIWDPAKDNVRVIDAAKWEAHEEA